MATSVHGHGNVGWTPEPSTRGTASLVYSCISTTIICTWSALHLNVPVQQDASNTSLFFRKLRYLLAALVAPELIAVFAYNDWLDARALTRKMRSLKGHCTWSTPLSFFVVMYGVHVQYPSGQKIPLFAEYAVDYFQRNWLDPGSISLQVIRDKSKANGFNKTVASLQITWFLSQLITRAAAHVSITPLELFTVAYVICAVAAYAFWWHKPFDLQVALILPTQPGFPSEQERINQQDYEEFMVRPIKSLNDDLNVKRINTFFVIICAFFGACHLLGWNAHFPTPIERNL